MLKKWSCFKKARNDSVQTVKNQPNIKIYAIYFISLAGYTLVQNKLRSIQTGNIIPDVVCVSDLCKSLEHCRYDELLCSHDIFSLQKLELSFSYSNLVRPTKHRLTNAGRAIIFEICLLQY